MPEAETLDAAAAEAAMTTGGRQMMRQSATWKAEKSQLSVSVRRLPSPDQSIT